MKTKITLKLSSEVFSKAFMKIIGRSNPSQRITKRKQMFESTKVNETFNE